MPRVKKSEKTVEEKKKVKKTSGLSAAKKTKSEKDKTKVSTRAKVKKDSSAKAKISKKKVVRKTSKKPVSVKKNSKEKTKNKDVLMNWIAPDFVRTQGELWLYRVSFALSFFMAIGLFQSSKLSSVTFLVLMVVVGFELKSSPRNISYEVNTQGVVVDGKMTRFEEIRSFDISYKAGFDTVRLQMKSSVFPIKTLFLDSEYDLVYVKTVFEYFLPEEEQEEKLFNFKAEKEVTDDELVDKFVDEYFKKNP